MPCDAAGRVREQCAKWRDAHPRSGYAFFTYCKERRIVYDRKDNCLGHSTVSVTLNIYTHLDWSSKENAAKAMENAVKLPENVQIASKWES